MAALRNISDMETIQIHIRSARAADLRRIANVHFDAVRANAAEAYPPEIVWHWAAAYDDPARLVELRAGLALRTVLVIVAEVDGEVCGFGAVSPSADEIYAVSVAPAVGRRGVGSAILRRLEELAAQRGASRLRVQASLNAEPFYRANGYNVDRQGIFHLKSDVEMACVIMSKELANLPTDRRR